MGERGGAGERVSVTFPELKTQNSLHSTRNIFYHWSADSAAVGLFGTRGPFLPRAGLGVGVAVLHMSSSLLRRDFELSGQVLLLQGQRCSAAACLPVPKQSTGPRPESGVGQVAHARCSACQVSCRGRRGGRFGLLMWSSFGDVIANCFRPRRSLLYSEAEWGPLEGFQWAPSRRPVEASLYPGQGGGEESQRRLPQSSIQGRGWEELLESDRL